MLTRTTFRSSPSESSQFYRCPTCDEIVDGQQLSEVLEHHQHVLDPYRFLILRAAGNAHTAQTEGNLGKARTMRQ
jgi:hypothetical protein